MMIEIIRFEPAYEKAVIGLIVAIQREEFGLAMTADAQPDLNAIPDFYQSGKGDFWLAKYHDTIVGTIGLKDIGCAQAALRKMFVAADFRGKKFSISSRLLNCLLESAKKRGIEAIFLGTTDKFLAAHHFYEKNGFSEISKTDLPMNFPVMAVDSKFYVLQNET